MSYCCCEFEEAVVPSSPLLECLGPQFCVHTRLTILPRGRNPQRPVLVVQRFAVAMDLVKGFLSCPSLIFHSTRCLPVATDTDQHFQH